MNDLRAIWARLGFMFAVRPAEEEPDLEQAIVSALAVVRDDPRLFVGVATWLHRYGAFVDGHRVVAKLGSESSPETSAVLGALITASAAPSLRGLRARCEPLPQLEPLFRIMASPVLRNRVEQHALPEYEEWGFLVDTLELKSRALRPPSWVLRTNPTLLVRAVVGPGARAAVFDSVLRDGPPPSLAALARGLDRSYPSVHAAVGALVAAGLLERDSRGRAINVRVPEDVAVWLAEYPGAMKPARRQGERSSSAAAANAPT